MPDRLIVDFMMQTVWAMDPTILGQLTEVVIRHAKGKRLSKGQLGQIRGRSPERLAPGPGGYAVHGRTAVIHIDGVMAKHSYQVNDVSQPRGTSAVAIGESVAAALDDSSVERIVFNIYSPGGSVEGIADVADEIFAAGEHKETIAVCNELACSAAYWIAAQCNRICATQTARVGCIGAYMVVWDSSKAFEEAGVTVHVIDSGGVKGAGEPGTEIEEAHLVHWQQQIDATTAVFIEAIARGRNVSSDVAAGWADGCVHIGASAINAGLVDEISTLEGVLGEGSRPIERAGAVSATEAHVVIDGDVVPVVFSNSANGDDEMATTTNRRTRRAAASTDGKTARKSAAAVEDDRKAKAADDVEDDEEKETETAEPVKDDTEDEDDEPASASKSKATEPDDDDEKDMTSRAASFQAAFPDNPSFALQALGAGLTLAQAKAVAPKEPDRGADSAGKERRGAQPLRNVLDDDEGVSDGEEHEFLTRINDLRAKGMSRREAFVRVKRSNPQLASDYNEWMKERHPQSAA